MKEELLQIKAKLELLEQMVQSLRPDLENIRRHYKFQNEETDSSSEAMIVNYSNHDNYHDILVCLRELIEFEEERDY